jgi:hypothetical protein
MSVGTTVATSALDITGLEATYLVDAGDGAVDRVPAVPDPTHGAWTTQLHAPAPVQFTLPDLPAPIPRQFDFPSMQLAVLFAALEHPNRAPAPDGATFAYTVALDSPAAGTGATYQSYVVGAWLRRDFASAEAVVDMTGMLLTVPAYSFTGAHSVAGRAMPDAVTTDDAFLVLRYVGGLLTGYAEASPFAQTEAATTVAMNALTTVAADRMVNLTLDPAALTARYMKPAPAPTSTTPAISWNLVAAPGYRIASNAGPVLYSGTTATGVTASYGNPFAARGWNTIFTLATSTSRVFMLPSGSAAPAAPVTLFAGMNQFLEPPAAADPATALTLPAVLPTRVLLNDVVLNSDGVTVRPPSSFVTVTFEVEAEPAAGSTFYSLQVWDLVYNATSMAAERRSMYVAASDHRTFRLPPELFQAGHTYTLRAFATTGGIPGLAEGDFVHRELPLAQSFLDSGVFTVSP